MHFIFIGSGFGSYLLLNLNFTLIKPIVDTLNKTFEGSLRGRGEAHNTIISPLEFKSGLKSGFLLKWTAEAPH
jgi:hypothetical protein